MAKKLKITFSAKALNDIEDWKKYLEGEGVPETGKKWAIRLLSSVERLANHPLSGRLVPEFSTVGLREILYPPFRLVYRVKDDEVQIVRVWRSERNLKLSRLEN